MMTFREYFHDIRIYISHDIREYQQLISEYPYLDRLIKHAAIAGFSLLWLISCNIPILWRLGWIFSALQTIAVFGLLIGVFGGLNPYLVLEKVPKPYRQLNETIPKKSKSSKHKSHMFLHGLLSIISSLIAITAMIIIYPPLPDLVINIIVIAIGLNFLFGLYRCIYCLEIHKIIISLFKISISLFSISWWKNLLSKMRHLSVSIVIDRRNRIERIQDNISTNEVIDPLEKMYESMRVIKNDDYVIVSIKNKPRSFIQFYKTTGAIKVELPLLKNAKNKLVLRQAIKLVKDNGVCKDYRFINIPLCPNSYYYLSHWTDESNKVRGDVLIVVCKNDNLLASKLGLLLLEHIYDWNRKTTLDYEIGSFDTSWWNKW